MPAGLKKTEPKCTVMHATTNWISKFCLLLLCRAVPNYNRQRLWPGNDLNDKSICKTTCNNTLPCP
jgi:hypothetical protein